VKILPPKYIKKIKSKIISSKTNLMKKGANKPLLNAKYN
jgi:hypothetical protein